MWAIVKDESSFREFIGSNSPEALPYKDFKSGKIKTDDTILINLKG